MKRLYYCTALAIAIFSVILYGDHTVKTFHHAACQAILLAQKQLDENNRFLTEQTISDGIESLREQEDLLNIFLPSEALRELDTALYAAKAYTAAGNTEEAFAELARAESCLHQIQQQYFKLL